MSRSIFADLPLLLPARDQLPSLFILVPAALVALPFLAVALNVAYQLVRPPSLPCEGCSGLQRVEDADTEYACPLAFDASPVAVAEGPDAASRGVSLGPLGRFRHLYVPCSLCLSQGSRAVYGSSTRRPPLSLAYGMDPCSFSPLLDLPHLVLISEFRCRRLHVPQPREGPPLPPSL